MQRSAEHATHLEIDALVLCRAARLRLQIPRDEEYRRAFGRKRAQPLAVVHHETFGGGKTQRPVEARAITHQEGFDE